MKKFIYLLVLVLILGLVLSGCSLLSNVGQVPTTSQTKVKPTGTGNLAGAEKVPWNLSGAVMLPPWGLHDIPYSDTASKLIVNQPNGNTEVTITGAMNGLDSSTTYTVCLADSYEPYIYTGWNVGGTYVINVVYLNVDYPETLILTQSGVDITGVSLDTNPYAPASHFTIDDGTVIDNVINIYANHGSLVVHMVGTIAADGSMSGTWADVSPGTRIGTWASTSGGAVKTYTGGTVWPGLFNTQETFTFMTDAYGSGSWHINLRDSDFSNLGIHNLSVWINDTSINKTILISNNFQVEVSF